MKNTQLGLRDVMFLSYSAIVEMASIATDCFLWSSEPMHLFSRFVSGCEHDLYTSSHFPSQNTTRILPDILKKFCLSLFVNKINGGAGLPLSNAREIVDSALGLQWAKWGNTKMTTDIWLSLWVKTGLFYIDESAQIITVGKRVGAVAYLASKWSTYTDSPEYANSHFFSKCLRKNDGSEVFVWTMYNEREEVRKVVLGLLDDYGRELTYMHKPF